MFGFGHSSKNYDNPADSAMPYLEQIPGTVSPYYNPYINLGKGAARMSAPIYYQRATNPEDYYSSIMEGYNESPDTQYRQQQALAQEQAAANAGGFSGTTYDQGQQGYITNGLLAEDQQRYLNDILGIQNSGLSAGMNYFNTGFNSSNTLAQMLGQNLAAEAGLAYQGTAFQDQLKAQQRANRNSLFGSTIGAGFGFLGGRNNNSYYEPQPNYYSSPMIEPYSQHYP